MSTEQEKSKGIRSINTKDAITTLAELAGWFGIPTSVLKDRLKKAGVPMLELSNRAHQVVICLEDLKPKPKETKDDQTDRD